MLNNNCKSFVDVDFNQCSKAGQGAAGDVFLSRRLPKEDRIVCVLADGLGSGVKANVLATLTATMALNYVCSDIDIRRASEIIMSTLPVCSERKIAYSTFTIIDIQKGGTVRMIEHDNPSYLLLRNGKSMNIEKARFTIKCNHIQPRELWYSRFQAVENDRAVVFSDGVTQSGMGTPKMPLGWGQEAAEEYIQKACEAAGNISARQLSKMVIQKGVMNDQKHAKDDISCGVINFRKPRELLVMTGPPIQKKNDVRMAEIVRDYPGRKVVCGGTTANIIAREFKESVTVDLSMISSDVPPASYMKGVDMVTEGTLTLSKSTSLLERGGDFDNMQNNAAVKLAKYFIESDIIRFVVGTKINDAHQDPNLPVELDIRRNLIKRVVNLLNEKYLKRASMEFI